MKLKSSITILTLALTLFLGTASAHASATEHYNIDSGHSRVTFRIKHFGVAYFYGQFFDVTGSFKVDSKNIKNSAVTIKIKVDSIDTHDAKRDGHLKSPDFFNAKAFPFITFTGKKFKKISADKIEVTGDLMLHGVSKSIAVTLTHIGAGKDPWGGYRSGYDGEFTIKRSNYGMKFMLDGIGDEVTITMGIEGIRK